VPLFQLRLAGYGLLTIGAINLIFAGVLSPRLITTLQGRLSMANGLIGFVPWLLLSLALIFVQGNRKRLSREQLPMLLLHRLLLPIAIGYLLLVPLMVRDALGYNGSVQSEIKQELKNYRAGSNQLLEQVRPLTTPLAVARVLQRYPNISVTVDPADSAPQIKGKLAEALSMGQARLQNRLDEVRRTRLEGLFLRTMGSMGVALAAAFALFGLRRQNLAMIRDSGGQADAYFAADQLMRSQGSFRRRSGSGFSDEWLGLDQPVGNSRSEAKP
jgi:hypothetical protein